MTTVFSTDRISCQCGWTQYIRTSHEQGTRVELFNLTTGGIAEKLIRQGDIEATFKCAQCGRLLE